VPWSLPAGSGPAVRLEVTDTGSGMAAKVMPRIFDPFFTTRFAGRGLGLPVVQGIVRRLGGTIEVESTAGEGSRFTVVLPCASARWPSESTEDHRPNPASPAAATVLFVEDEPALRSAGAKLLKGKNFRVIEAGDGAAAVEFLESDPGSIDVVLLDITLPGMPSGEIFDKLRQIRPDLKVILTTAYSRDSTIAEFRERDTWGFIRKPYNTGDLVELLRRAVNGGA
jgi:two-component system, cell cycle sensor histidine kinase and response regulator CckA